MIFQQYCIVTFFCPLVSFFTLVHTTSIAAKFHFFPDFFPLFAPRERLAARFADFRRQILFFDVFHQSNSGKLLVRANGNVLIGLTE